MLEWLKRHAWKACVPQKGIRSSNLLLSAQRNLYGRCRTARCGIARIRGCRKACFPAPPNTRKSRPPASPAVTDCSRSSGDVDARQRGQISYLLSTTPKSLLKAPPHPPRTPGNPAAPSLSQSPSATCTASPHSSPRSASSAPSSAPAKGPCLS